MPSGSPTGRIGRPHLRVLTPRRPPLRPDFRPAASPPPDGGRDEESCASTTEWGGAFERMLGRGGGCLGDAAGIIFVRWAPRLPPPALAALGHPPPLREGGENGVVFASTTEWGRRVRANARTRRGLLAVQTGAERRGRPRSSRRRDENCRPARPAAGDTRRPILCSPTNLSTMARCPMTI